jgi:hypothetical protein
MPACPAGVTWTGRLGLPLAVNLIGQGPGVTVINDNLDKTGCVFSATTGPLITLDNTNNNWTTAPTTPGFRISGFTIRILNAPSVDCSRMRIYSVSQAMRLDHIDFLDVGGPTNSSTNSQAGQQDLLITVDGPWGVIDHINMTPYGTGRLSQQSIKIVHKRGWGSFRAGDFGDQSWYRQASWGTNQQVFVEDVTDTLKRGAKIGCEVPGGRCTIRHNTGLAGIALHGTDSGGRQRSSRQLEIYDNEFGCDRQNWFPNQLTDPRGGAMMWFRNTIDNTTPFGVCYTSFAPLSVFRETERFYPWGTCDGTAIWDHNEGITRASGTASAGSVVDTLTVTPSPNWTPDAFVGYSLTNADNNSVCPWGLPIPMPGGGLQNCNQLITVGTGQVPANTVPGTPWGAVILSNTANTITTKNSIYAQQYPASAPANHMWTVGDHFSVQRAISCIDGIGIGSGGLLSGFTSGQQTPPFAGISCTAPPIGSSGACTNGNDLNQALDPVYSWLNTVDGQPQNITYGVAGSIYVIQNVHFYNQRDNFDGSNTPGVNAGLTGGIGVGLLSARPTQCTPLVGYWATDTNTLYQCTAPNTWTVHYQPYTYPHPLTLQATMSANGHVVETGDGHVAFKMPSAREIREINERKRRESRRRKK